MGKEDGGKLDINFVLKPDSRAPVRLLPIVAGLVLSPTTEDEQPSDGHDVSDDSEACDH